MLCWLALNLNRHWCKVISSRYVFTMTRTLTCPKCFWKNISYGTAKSGVGISAMAVLRPDQMMKCSIPVVMAGIIAVSRFTTSTALFHFIDASTP